MKKISNFTQTYKTNPDYTWGADQVDREYLFDYLLKDKTNLWLRSKLDLHNISFHNYTKEDATKILKKVREVLPETKGFIYNNMTYPESFLKHLNNLKELGMTDIFWIQDDEYFIYNSLEDIEALINYYRNDPSIVNIQLGLSSSILVDKNGSFIEPKGELITDHLILHRTTCKDFSKFDKLHPFPSGACLINIDLLIEILNNFNEHIKNKNAYDVESLMGILGTKFNVQRCSLNIPFLKAYNMSGMGGSLGKSEKYKEELNLRL